MRRGIGRLERMLLEDITMFVLFFLFFELLNFFYRLSLTIVVSGIFKAQFDSSVNKALTTGIKGAFVEGCTYGVASGLIYLAEALLFFIGAVLISRGLYTYLQMVKVLNFIVFSVTIGSQLMAFSKCFLFFFYSSVAEKIAKSVQATHTLHKYSIT